MSAPAAPLVPSDVDKLSYAALKKECADRGIDASGNKQKLVYLLRAQLNAPPGASSVPAAHRALISSGTTWGALNQDVWKQILLYLVPLPRLYRLTLINKAFKTLIEEMLQQRKGGRNDYALPSLRRPWRRFNIHSGSTPKVQATIQAVHMSFDPTNIWGINIAWLHDWGTLFEDWDTQVDLRTSNKIPTKWPYAKTAKDRDITDAKGYRFYVDKDLTTVKVVGKNSIERNAIAFDNRIVCIAIHPYGILAVLLEDRGDRFYIALC